MSIDPNQELTETQAWVRTFDETTLHTPVVLPPPVPDPALDVHRAQAIAGAELHGSIRAEITMVDLGITTDVADMARRIHHYLAEYEVAVGSIRNNDRVPF